MTLVDLSYPRSFAEGFPHEFFEWLRREHPLWWHEPTGHTPDGEGFWVVSRYHDAVTVMRDPASYSSGDGTQIDHSLGNGLMLNSSDDPQHRRLRSLVSAGFTPRTIGRLEDDLRRRARTILDAVPANEPFDFVGLVARELPLQAICSILGIPQDDRAELAELVNLAVEAETGEALGSTYMRLLAEYGRRLIDDKRSQPADDILSVIVHARTDDGSQLTPKEVGAFFNLLFPAGAETTRGAIAGGLLALIEHPDELRRARSDPTIMRTAVEEILRWTSPSAYKRRTATRDCELAGQTIRSGQKVTYWEMSANRDDTVFPEPFRFDVARDPNPHVAFGLGPHFCLGASLARLELRVMFEELLDRFHFELAGAPRYPKNNRLVGLVELPVRATPVGKGHQP